MKVHWKVACALAIAAGFGLEARAQYNYSGSPQYAYADDPASPSASDTPQASKPAQDPMADAVPMVEAESVTGDGACEEAEEEECKACELFGTTCGGIHVYGWMQAGAMYHEYGPGVRFGGPLAVADRNEAMLNQVYMIAEKTVDTESCCWNYGGRVDLLYGSDYIYTQSTGLETRPNGAPHWNANPNYGLALPQAYVEIGGNDLSLKVGHFYTFHGYEVMTPTGNFFYSHNYMVRYAEPTTHTGAMATYKLNDCVSVVGAVHNGWDAFDKVDDELQVMGGFTYTPCHEQYTVAYALTVGDDVGGVGGSTNRVLSSLVFNWKVNDCWTYVFHNDIGWQDDFFTVGEDAEWYGVANYLFRELNDCWKVGARLEWFRDDDAVRVVGARAGNPYGGGSAGHFYEATLGANYTPHANVNIRPEIRYDWFDGVGTAPFNNNTEDEQLSLAIDVIVTF